jgi:hypothetical protein
VSLTYQKGNRRSKTPFVVLAFLGTGDNIDHVFQIKPPHTLALAPATAHIANMAELIIRRGLEEPDTVGSFTRTGRNARRSLRGVALSKSFPIMNQLATSQPQSKNW